MTENRIVSGCKEKTFLLATVTSSKYDALVIKATDDEIESSFKQSYDVDGNGEYSVLTPTQRVDCSRITEVLPGDVIRISPTMTLIRLD